MDENLAKLRAALPITHAKYKRICTVFPLDCPPFNFTHLEENFKWMDKEGKDFFRRHGAQKDSTPDPFVKIKTKKNPMGFPIKSFIPAISWPSIFLPVAWWCGIYSILKSPWTR
jgi:hypothetical protein